MQRLTRQLMYGVFLKKLKNEEVQPLCGWRFGDYMSPGYTCCPHITADGAHFRPRDYACLGAKLNGRFLWRRARHHVVPWAPKA